MDKYTETIIFDSEEEKENFKHNLGKVKPTLTKAVALEIVEVEADPVEVVEE